MARRNSINEADDLLERGARGKNLLYAEFLEDRHILGWNDSAAEEHDIGCPVPFEPVGDIFE